MTEERRSPVVRHRLRAGFHTPVLRTAVSVVLASMWGLLQFARLAAASGAYVLFGGLGIVLAAWLTTFVPTHVTVGRDGLFIERMGRRRFLPFGRMRGIGSDPRYADAVVLEMREGADIRLRTVARDHDIKPNATTVALRTSVREALQAFERRERADALATLVARGERSTSSWLAELRGMRAGGTYRVAAVTEEGLWRIAEDAGADPSARAGALAALRVDLDAQGRERAREIAAGCASPRVRVALEAALVDDEKALTEALDTLDAPTSDHLAT